MHFNVTDACSSDINKQRRSLMRLFSSFLGDMHYPGILTLGSHKHPNLDYNYNYFYWIDFKNKLIDPD